MISLRSTFQPNGDFTALCAWQQKSFTSTQFKRLNNSILPINRTLSGATTQGQSRPRSNGNEGVLHISQSSRNGASTLDCFVSLVGDGSNPYAEKQSAYFTTPADWTEILWRNNSNE